MLLAGELGVMHGRGVGCLQWRTNDVVYAVCCIGNTANVPHPQLIERSFLFYCVTRPCTEFLFCSLLLNPADPTKAWPVCTPLTGKALVKWYATTSYHFQMNCFRFVESYLCRRLVKFPFLIVLLGWVAQDLYLGFIKILNERIILRVQITCITGRGKDEVNFSGTSICEAVSCISEMLLSQLQTLWHGKQRAKNLPERNGCR